MIDQNQFFDLRLSCIMHRYNFSSIGKMGGFCIKYQEFHRVNLEFIRIIFKNSLIINLADF